MNKIEFKNLPDTSTPLNAENLNTMQDNIEGEIATKIDKKIVATNLSTAGWYRVAKYNNDGQNSIAFILNINSRFSNNNNQSATINVNIIYNKAKLTTIASLVNRNTVSKVRVVQENGICYIEVYYNASAQNPILIDILSQKQYDSTVISMLNFEAPTDTAKVLDELVIETSNAITTGTEFETGRVIDGKKEYAKRIDCGAMPNAAEKRVSHGITNVYQYTKIEGIAKYGDTILPLPYIDVATPSRSIGIYLPNATQIYMYSGYNWSSFTGYVTIYYTKN